MPRDRESCAVILKMTYGYNVEPRGSDPLVELAEKAVDQICQAMLPGTWLVDYLPICIDPGVIIGGYNKANEIYSEVRACLGSRCQVRSYRQGVPQIRGILSKRTIYICEKQSGSRKLYPLLLIKSVADQPGKSHPGRGDNIEMVWSRILSWRVRYSTSLAPRNS